MSDDLPDLRGGEKFDPELIKAARAEATSREELGRESLERASAEAAETTAQARAAFVPPCAFPECQDAGNVRAEITFDWSVNVPRTIPIRLCDEHAECVEQSYGSSRFSIIERSD